MEKYLYEVHPVRPVISPNIGRRTRRPFSAEFTAEEVKALMPNARMYRRFPDHDIVPVTGATLMELHRPRFDMENIENHNDDEVEKVVESTKVEEPVSTIKEPVETVSTEEDSAQASSIEDIKINTEMMVQDTDEEVVDPVETTTNAVSDLVIQIPSTEPEETKKSVDLETEVAQSAEKQVSENGYVYSKKNKFHKKH